MTVTQAVTPPPVPTMSEVEARTFHEAADAYVHRLNKMTLRTLAIEYQGAQADRGLTTIAGGPRGKQEHISTLMQLRYPVATFNQTTHILYHRDGGWGSACEWCNGTCTTCGALVSEPPRAAYGHEHENTCQQVHDYTWTTNLGRGGWLHTPRPRA